MTWSSETASGGEAPDKSHPYRDRTIVLQFFRDDGRLHERSAKMLVEPAEDITGVGVPGIRRMADDTVT